MSEKFDGKNYYEILGVSEDASKEVIKKAYKEIALVYHPDSNFFNEILGGKYETEGSLEDFQIITNAFNVLTDDEKRKEYDKTIVHFKDWGDGESVDDYFQDMLDKKAAEYSVRHIGREREQTVSGLNADRSYFQSVEEARKNKFGEKSEEYKNSINNSKFSQIAKTRFSNKLDLLVILMLGLLATTVVLYLVAY